MNKFGIICTDNENYRAFIIMRCSDSPLQYLDQIQKALSEKKISGNILIDQLLHSGNNAERFIKAYFDSKQFDAKTFNFENISKDAEYRKISCSYFKNAKLIKYSLLNTTQKRMMEEEITI